MHKQSIIKSLLSSLSIYLLGTLIFWRSGNLSRAKFEFINNETVRVIVLDTAPLIFLALLILILFPWSYHTFFRNKRNLKISLLFQYFLSIVLIILVNGDISHEYGGFTTVIILLPVYIIATVVNLSIYIRKASLHNSNSFSNITM